MFYELSFFLWKRKFYGENTRESTSLTTKTTTKQTMSIQEEIWVHSKALDDETKYLSNFTHVPGDFIIPFGSGAERFASVELAYHAHKMLHLVGGPRVDLALRFTTSGIYGRFKDGGQKAAGGRSAFKKLGVVLDTKAWNAAAPSIMRKLIGARSEADVKFNRYCICFVQEKKLVIRHFARGVFYRSKKTGKLFGHDMLGPLLVEVGSGIL